MPAGWRAGISGRVCGFSFVGCPPEAVIPGPERALLTLAQDGCVDQPVALPVVNLRLAVGLQPGRHFCQPKAAAFVGLAHDSSGIGGFGNLTVGLKPSSIADSSPQLHPRQYCCSVYRSALMMSGGPYGRFNIAAIFPSA